jgi:hypothetical protein
MCAFSSGQGECGAELIRLRVFFFFFTSPLLPSFRCTFAPRMVAVLSGGLTNMKSGTSLTC